MRSTLHGQMACIKYFMFFINCLVLIAGLILLTMGGLGEVLYGSVRHLAHVGFSSASIILIVIGCFLTIVGFTGCHGSIRENPLTLRVFSYLLVLIILLEIVLSSWIYFAHVKVYTVLEEFVSRILSRYEMDNDIKRLIDKVQEKYSCCGAKGYDDWYDSSWNKHRQNSSVSIWIDSVPHSCCLKNTTHLKNCGYNIDTPSKPASKFVNTPGCFQYLERLVLRHMGLVVTVAITTVMVEVMALLFACCLRRAIMVGRDREPSDAMGLVV